MIISHKYKYIFVGLPFGASSTITKELMDLYEGESLFDKHANIPLLLKEQPQINLSEYYVFVVVRDPVEFAFVQYNKYLLNARGAFTDPQFFIENGGYVTPAIRKFYKKFHEKDRTFEDYLLLKYKYMPFDNNLSINAKYTNGYIRFTHLNEDFQKILKEINIPVIRDLPIYNKTEKISQEYKITPALKKRIFDTFFYVNIKYFPDERLPQIPIFDKLKFSLFQKIRYYKILKRDMREMTNEFSIKDLKKMEKV